MPHLKLPLLVIIYFLFGFQLLSAQCMMVPISLQQRVDSSKLVLEGKIIGSFCTYDDEQKNIYTVYDFLVYKKFKGADLHDTIRFVEMGGTVGLRKLETSIQLNLPKASLGIAMLIPSNDPFDLAKNYYELYAGPQGFISYNRLDSSAAGVFDTYESVQDGLYNTLNTLSGVPYEELKTIDWGSSESISNPPQIGSSNNLQSTSSANLSNGPASAISSTAAISSFSPTSINAGRADTLTINGSGFGATQGSSYVQFRNANSTTSTSYISPQSPAYISWSDVQIKVLVPYNAGTGTIKVSDGTTTKTSTGTLTVNYAISNVTSSATGTNTDYIPKIINDDLSGGYTFQYYSGFTNASAKTYFETALNDWRCATNMNWKVSTTTTTINTIADDNTNVVRFDVGSELTAGVLGTAYSYFSGCIVGSVVYWVKDEIDVAIDDGTNWYYGTGTPGTTQYDYYSMIIHELGHGHGLGHVLTTTDFMYPSIANGTFNRTISTYNDAAGTYMVTNTAKNTSCATDSLQVYACTPNITLSVSSTSVTEAATTLTVTATADGLNASAVSVTLSTSGTATGGGTDYTLASTTISIPAWSKTGTTTITIVNDALYENSETIILDISAVSNGLESGTQQKTITITNDDAAPTVTLSTGFGTINEGGVGTNVIATLSAVSGLATTVNLSYSGTATSGSDYTPVTTLVVPAGSTTVASNLAPIEDVIYEGTETIIIDISTVSNGTENGTQSQTISLLDNETAPTVTLAVSSTAVSESAGTYTVTVTSSVASTQVITVNLSFSGTATGSGVDYSAASSITIAAGNTSATTTVNIVDDAVYEGSTPETIIIDISTVTNASENGTQTQTTSIADNDAAPTVTLSVSPATILEAIGTTTVTLTRSASSPVATTVSLSYSGIAVSGTDYSGASTSVTIAANSSSATFTITAIDDLVYEGSGETFSIDISAVSNGTENGTQQSTVTITDNDLAPFVSLSASASSFSENGGSTVITLSLSAVSGVTAIINLAYGGVAASSSDYTGGTASVSIPAGSTSTSYTITAVNNTTYEGNETFTIDISSASNATELAIQQLTLTVIEDDAAPAVNLSSAASSIAEAAGTTNLIATQSFTTAVATIVNLSFSGTASNGTDYSVATSISIPAGSTSASIALSAIQDALYETNETVIVDISSVNNASENGVQQTTVTIVDDEIAPVVSIAWSNTSIGESAAGTSNAVVTQSFVSAVATTVTLTLSGTATVNSDYSITATTLTIPAGSTTGFVTMNNIADNIYEGNENVGVTIAAATNASISVSNPSAFMTINDDDPIPSVTLSLSPSSIAESGGSATLTATLSNPSTQAITVNFAYSGTATSINDYNANNSFTIAALSTSGSTPISIVDDNVYETNETVIADISSVSNGTENGNQQVTLTISDNEAMPVISLNTSTLSVTEGANTLVEFSQNIVSGLTTTVYLHFSGTASSATDYTIDAFAQIMPGSSGALLVFNASDDILYEGLENVSISIDSITNGTKNGTQTKTIQINDNDSPPSVSINATPSSISENAQFSEITASLSAVSGLTTTVYVSLSGTATYLSDYSTVGVPIVIPAGSSSAVMDIDAIQDLVYEGNETAIVSIDSVQNGVENGNQSVTVTIVDDETVPLVSMSPSATSINEGDAATLTFTQNKLSSQATTITLFIYGTAGNGTDFTLPLSAVIPAGALSVSVAINTINDNIYEYDETIQASILTVANGAANGTQTFTASIVDNDLPPSVSIQIDSSAISETGGSAIVTGTLSGAAERDLFTYFSFGGTATYLWGGIMDYTRSNNQLWFVAGTTTATFTITAINDSVYENVETVILQVDSSQASLIGSATYTLNLLSDDAVPSVSLQLISSAVPESYGTVNYNVTLSGQSDLPTTVVVAFSGTAQSNDYTKTDTIVIAANALYATSSIQITTDTLDEDDETIVLDISTVTNAVENGAQQQTITIVDDDDMPILSLSAPLSLVESGGTYSGTLSLSEVSGRDVTVNLGFVHITTSSADISLSNTSVNILAGSLSANFIIQVFNDTLDEAPIENCSLFITSAVNATTSGANFVQMSIADDEFSAAKLLINTQEIFASDTYLLGNVQAGTNNAIPIILVNTGNAVLNWTSSSANTNYVLDFSGADFSLAAGDTTTFSLLVSADCDSFGQTLFGTIYFNSNTDTEPLAQYELGFNVVDTVGPSPLSVTLSSVNASCELSITNFPQAIDCSDTITASTSDPLYYSHAGNYSITWIYTDAHGNTTSQVQQVSISSGLPIISGLSDTVLTCVGNSVTFTASGASTYNWSGGVLNGVAFTPVSSILYTLSAANAAGCTSTASVYNLVYSAPPVSVSSNGSLYTNDQLQLNGTTLSGASYTWQGPNAFSASTASASISNVTTQHAGVYTYTLVDAAGCSNSATISVSITASVMLAAKVYLSGPFVSATALMNDNLRTLNLIPLTEPYTGYSASPSATFVHYGSGGGESTTNAVLSVSGPNAIVDWIFVQLRNASNPATIIETRSALLQRDGDIVDVDGVSALRFRNSAPGTYIVSIKHRNHLGLELAAGISLGETAGSLDFTNSSLSVYQAISASNLPYRTISAYRTMYSGDVNHDAQVKYNGAANDRLSVLSKTGSATNVLTNSYTKEDVNMDGQVKYNGVSNDRLVILQNVGTNVNTVIKESGH